MWVVVAKSRIKRRRRQAACMHGAPLTHETPSCTRTAGPPGAAVGDRAVVRVPRGGGVERDDRPGAAPQRRLRRQRVRQKQARGVVERARVQRAASGVVAGCSTSCWAGRVRCHPGATEWQDVESMFSLNCCVLVFSSCCNKSVLINSVARMPTGAKPTTLPASMRQENQESWTAFNTIRLARQFISSVARRCSMGL